MAFERPDDVHPMAESLNRTVREAARLRRIPKGARCAVCGFAHPTALESWGKRWRCAECAKRARGQEPTEAHHILGRRVHPKTVKVMANLHRVLSDKQLDLPAEVLAHAREDPLAFAALLLRAQRDFCEAMADFQGAAITSALRLREALVRKYGQDWPTRLGLPPLFPDAGE
jgi:hypothetical protein